MRLSRAPALLAVAGVTGLFAAATAQAHIGVLIDDEPDIVRMAFEPLPGGVDKLLLEDDPYQVETNPRVLPRSREMVVVPAEDLRGRSAEVMATVLRGALRTAGARRAIVDGVGSDFRGADADNLAEALRLLSARDKSPWTRPKKGEWGRWQKAEWRRWRQPLSRRVHLYLSDVGDVLTGEPWAGARLAMARSGGVWLRTTSAAAGPWTADQWLAWPDQTATLLTTMGSSAARAHVVFGPGDPGPVWRLALKGSACPVLASGPGARGLGPDVVSFVAGFRAAFGPPGAPTAPACVPAPAVPASAATALEGAAEREATGLAIPPGGLLSPPLVAGEPAQLTVGLGTDPLGLAEAAGLPPERLLTAGAIHVRADAPGTVARATVQGDGSARLAFTPRSAGPVTLTLEVDASVAGVLAGERAGTAAELVRPLERVGSSALLPRTVAAPGRWRLAIPLMRAGGGPGDPVLEVRPAA